MEPALTEVGIDQEHTLPALCDRDREVGGHEGLTDPGTGPGDEDPIIGALEKTGLTEVLGQKLTPAEAVQGIKNVENLDVLTRGDTPPNPSELLLTPRLGETLEWASGNYDTVIVDSPPVLAVTDAVIVGQLCGIALMIARFSESAHKEVTISANRLRQNGVNLRGSIMNAVEKRASSYYGYGGYYAYDYRKTKDQD